MKFVNNGIISVGEAHKSYWYLIHYKFLYTGQGKNEHGWWEFNHHTYSAHLSSINISNKLRTQRVCVDGIKTMQMTPGGSWGRHAERR
jgi:hypothetical protein